MPLYPNGRAPKQALVDVYGSPSSPGMAQRVLWVKGEYDATHSDELQINQIYRFFGNAGDYAVGFQDWKNGWDRSGTLEFGASQFYVAGVAAAGGPSAATIGGSNHGDWDFPAVDWSCDNVEDRRALGLHVGLVHNIKAETWHAAALGSVQVALPQYASLRVVAAPPDDGFDERDLADILTEMETLRPIRLYALPGGWVWVGPGGRFWIVPSPAYVVLADHLGLAPSIPTPVTQEAFDFLTRQFLPALSPDPSNEALERVLSLSQQQVFSMIERMEV